MPKDNYFIVKMPIVKFWEEDIEIMKSGVLAKDNQKFIEVTVSGLKEDRDGEMMSQRAIDDMIMQFKSGTIPFFPDHGFHEQSGQKNVYSWKQMLGVFTDAKQENDKISAVIRLNKAHPDHMQLWEFVKEGMPLGFSIGGKPGTDTEFIECDEDVELNKSGTQQQLQKSMMDMLK